MKHLAYTHSWNYSLVETLSSLIRRMLPGPLRRPHVVAGRVPIWSRLLVCLGWILVLVIQAALVIVIKDVITLCHGVIDLYLDLATLQLDLQSQYVTVTTPGK